MDVPNPAPGDPSPPAHLGDVALAHWHRLAELLRAEKRLNLSAGPLLDETAAAFALVRHIEADVMRLSSLTFEKVTIDGAGQEQREPKAHPLLAQLRAARDQYRKHLNDLCLSPATIARAKVTAPAEPEGIHAFLRRA